MTAKDGEEVEFFKPYVCEGQVCKFLVFLRLNFDKVEKWLDGLMESMRMTIRKNLMLVGHS